MSVIATFQMISEWFDRGVAEGATHMLVVCDTFDNEDYPVYIRSYENVREAAKRYDNVNLQRLVEVYSMKLPKEEQLKAPRAWNWD